MTAWRMAFRVGEGGDSLWSECLRHGIAVIYDSHFRDVDLTKFPQDEPKDAWKQLRRYSSHSSSMRSFVYEMKPGDIIYVKEGPEIVGRGRIKSSYEFVKRPLIQSSEGSPWQHQRSVDWDEGFAPIVIQIGDQQRFTVRNVSVADIRKVEKAKVSRNVSHQLPEELVGDIRHEYVEGAVATIQVNAYERNSLARKACIAHYGYCCAVCTFNFSQTYGSLGDGYIHVHHLRSISSVKKAYSVDPVRDLRPVCPNCHAMLHRNREVLSIEELQKRIKYQSRIKNSASR